MRGRGLAAFVVAGAIFSARVSRAQEPTCLAGGSPWVRISLEGAHFTASLRTSVLQQITADLERRGLAVCEGGGEGAVAELRIALLHPASLSIELRDEVSRERFTREISLAGVPGDALGLSIAATAEELLHASWAQNGGAPSSAGPQASSPLAGASTASSSLAAQSPVPAAPPSPPGASSAAERPPERAAPDATDARQTDRRSSPRATALATQVCLLGAGETATQGATAFGADLGLTWGGRATLGARVGFRLAPEVSSAHGTVAMREGILRLAGAVALVPRRARWGAELLVHGDLLYVELEGVAAPAARALSGSAAGMVLSGGLGGWTKIARGWSIVGEATAGAPLYAVTASDSGTVVTGIRGPVIGFALGAATQL